LTFTSNDTINTGAAAGQYWGVWRVEVDRNGTFYTNSPAADQVYASEAAAIAALPTVTSGRASVGYITVQSKTDVDWVANTDDLTAASDCADVNFYDTSYNTPGDFSLEGFGIGFRRERGALLDQGSASAGYA
jgi:hypothetical protein